MLRWAYLGRPPEGVKAPEGSSEAHPKRLPNTRFQQGPSPSTPSAGQSIQRRQIHGVIYLDHHATTPVDPRVLEKMLPYFSEHFGNAASRSHRFGHRAEKAVRVARAQIASFLGSTSAEVVFTSGATESDNLALKGALRVRQTEGRNKLITAVTEHKAILDTAERLSREGAEVVVLGVDAHGRIDPEEFRSHLDKRTALVSLMWTNNEIGTVQPIAEVTEAIHDAGAWLHIDAAQGLGYLPLKVDELGVDLLSLTAHKIYGPKGAGALFVRRRERRLKLLAEMDGGGHEQGHRSGTLNVPGIVGLGQACGILESEGLAEGDRLFALRNRLFEGLKPLGATLNGAPLERFGRHPANLNVSFVGRDGASLLLSLNRLVACSSGSACSSGASKPSRVLLALGEEDDPACRERAATSLRFGLGRSTSEADIDATIAAVEQALAKAPALP